MSLVWLMELIPLGYPNRRKNWFLLSLILMLVDAFYFLRLQYEKIPDSGFFVNCYKFLCAINLSFNC